jgi:endonuclease YncB( thermonuclease family)
MKPLYVGAQHYLVRTTHSSYPEILRRYVIRIPLDRNIGMNPRLVMRHTTWLVVTVIALAVFLGCTTEAPTSTPTPFTIVVGPSAPTLDRSNCSITICCNNCPEIPVNRVIGGDTFVSGNTTIRLFGVYTPDIGEPCYDEAIRRFRELVGNSVRVEFGPRQEDQHGHIRYYVYTMEGESIDEMLAREGLALAWLEDGQHRNVLLALEGRANEGGRGCLGSRSGE